MKKIIEFIRKKCITNTSMTLVLVITLLVIFVALNVWVQTIDLAQIDVTENQLYSLTQATKQAVKDIEDDVIIYTFGYNEKSPLIDLLKQYNRENEHITYEILTKANNPEKVAEYELEEGYNIVVVESNGAHKLIDGSYQFSTYDYTTYQEIDTTEQTLTNAILSLTVEEKPKVYFIEGHGEYSLGQLSVIDTYLKNEVYDTSTINLLTAETIPEDCNVLTIMTPTSDITEKEAEVLKQYIYRGGNIIFFRDIELKTTQYPVLQTVLDLYGISMPDGCILESESKNMVSTNYPNIILPQLSASHEITKYLYSDGGYLVMMYAGKINIADDETLQKLGVQSETFISSSDTSVYIDDLSNISLDSISETGSNVIGAVLTKTIENSETNDITSKMVVVANNYFISDYKEETLSSTYPLSYFGNNKDIFLNSVAYLTEREDTLTIRKDTKNTTYVASSTQNNVILFIIFAVPIAIIIIGIIVWKIRKNRK